MCQCNQIIIVAGIGELQEIARRTRRLFIRVSGERTITVFAGAGELILPQS